MRSRLLYVSSDKAETIINYLKMNSSLQDTHEESSESEEETVEVVTNLEENPYKPSAARMAQFLSIGNELLIDCDITPDKVKFNEKREISTSVVKDTLYQTFYILAKETGIEQSESLSYQKEFLEGL